MFHLFVRKSSLSPQYHNTTDNVVQAGQTREGICSWLLNPSTPKSDQFQISPAASPEILHHTVWRTWLFIAYSDERWLYYQFSLPHLYIFSLRGWENVLFELRSERVKLQRKTSYLRQAGALCCQWRTLCHWQYKGFPKSDWPLSEIPVSPYPAPGCPLSSWSPVHLEGEEERGSLHQEIWRNLRKWRDSRIMHTMSSTCPR